MRWRAIPSTVNFARLPDDRSKLEFGCGNAGRQDDAIATPDYTVLTGRVRVKASGRLEEFASNRRRRISRPFEERFRIRRRAPIFGLDEPAARPIAATSNAVTVDRFS